MSKYTTELRYICETEAGLKNSKGYNDVNAIITAAAPKIFNFPFPIFEESYRLPLETKILKHYYTREIALETVGLWRLKLDTKINEIMPYYNELYKSALLEFNPLYDTDITRTHKTENTGEQRNNGTATNDSESSDTGNETNVSRDLFSDTPQGALTGIENNTYLTDARKITGENDSSNTKTAHSEGTSTATTNISNVEDFIENVKGKQGGQSFSALLKEFRANLINVDMMVINDLSDLFFNLW